MAFGKSTDKKLLCVWKCTKKEVMQYIKLRYRNASSPQAILLTRPSLPQSNRSIFASTCSQLTIWTIAHCVSGSMMALMQFPLRRSFVIEDPNPAVCAAAYYEAVCQRWVEAC